jgi:hypothetical protein
MTSRSSCHGILIIRVEKRECNDGDAGVLLLLFYSNCLTFFPFL